MIIYRVHYLQFFNKNFIEYYTKRPISQCHLQGVLAHGDFSGKCSHLPTAFIFLMFVSLCLGRSTRGVHEVGANRVCEWHVQLGAHLWLRDEGGELETLFFRVQCSRNCLGAIYRGKDPFHRLLTCTLHLNKYQYAHHILTT
jgi:hypothetical protein